MTSAPPPQRETGLGQFGRAWEGVEPEIAPHLIAAAGDIALLIDEGGVVRRVTVATAELPSEVHSVWAGMRLVDTVTPETRHEVEALLRECAAHGASGRRQVSHRNPDGFEFPVAYLALRLREGKGTLVLGRELGSVALLQQRLVETQQEMERGYWRLRHAETRYRLLLQHIDEAVLVVDAAARGVVEANAAAARLFDDTQERLLSRHFPFGFDDASIEPLNDALASARMFGRAAEARVTLRDGRSVVAMVSCFRQETSTMYFVRLLEPGAVASGYSQRRHAAVLDLMERCPDSFVVTDLRGTVIRANRAMLDLCQLSSDEQMAGRPLGDWIGRPGADLPVLLSTLKQYGVIRLLNTSVRGELGASAEIEVSAATAPDAEVPCHGFVIREVDRRTSGPPRGVRDLAVAVEHLTELVGRIALRDLLRDTTDLVERHFIEAALEMTGDNRTAAAELLGLSRQSLYVKLRRFQLLPAGMAERETGESRS